MNHFFLVKGFVCPEPTNTNENVMMQSVYGAKFYYNETVKVSCPYFYDQIGSDTMRCQANKTWSGENTTCLKSKSIFTRSFLLLWM